MLRTTARALRTAARAGTHPGPASPAARRTTNDIEAADPAHVGLAAWR
ncbi:MAG: hypothetical protein IPJ77_00395 [Planctomycetes bacterium]|nr:hypothetical protein [Planctomycetota bacterium]